MLKKIVGSKFFIIFLHIGFWCFLLALPHFSGRPPRQALMPGGGPDFMGPGMPPPFRDPAFQQPPSFNPLNPLNFFIIAFFYLNAYLLIPKLLYKNKKAVFTVTVLSIIILVGFLNHYINDLLHQPFPRRPFWGFPFPSMFPLFFTLAGSIAYRFVVDKIKDDEIKQQRENENLKTELSFLRSQISPHFIFNILNNLVSLARKKSDDLEPILIKLSNMMRYMLYETNEQVQLDTEVDYLKGFIELQQMRFGDKVKVRLNIEGDLNYIIEPMILISFVENAFKHGMGASFDPEISVDLIVKNDDLQFTVKNRYNAAYQEIRDKSSGIGLSNLRRRLNLLYGENHHLNLQQEDNWFTASLYLKLK